MPMIDSNAISVSGPPYSPKSQPAGLPDLIDSTKSRRCSPARLIVFGGPLASMYPGLLLRYSFSRVSGNTRNEPAPHTPHVMPPFVPTA